MNNGDPIAIAFEGFIGEQSSADGVAIATMGFLDQIPFGPPPIAILDAVAASSSVLNETSV